MLQNIKHKSFSKKLNLVIDISFVVDTKKQLVTLVFMQSELLGVIVNREFFIRRHLYKERKSYGMSHNFLDDILAYFDKLLYINENEFSSKFKQKEIE